MSSHHYTQLVEIVRHHGANVFNEYCRPPHRSWGNKNWISKRIYFGEIDFPFFFCSVSCFLSLVVTFYTQLSWSFRVKARADTHGEISIYNLRVENVAHKSVATDHIESIRYIRWLFLVRNLNSVFFGFPFKILQCKKGPCWRLHSINVCRRQAKRQRKICPCIFSIFFVKEPGGKDVGWRNRINKTLLFWHWYSDGIL